MRQKCGRSFAAVCTISAFPGVLYTDDPENRDKGHAYEDIIDNTKPVKEKQKMFDEVIQRMRSDVTSGKYKENQKWLAETMYNCHKKAM